MSSGGVVKCHSPPLDKPLKLEGKMSILDTNTLDGIAHDDSHGLVMLITDHLDWQNESEHLFALQAKINSYATFWEERQYKSIFPGRDFTSAVIEICAKFYPSENCKKFLAVAERELRNINVSLKLFDNCRTRIDFYDFES